MRASYVAQEDITRMMHEAGCRRIIIGLESGNEYIRNTVLRRNMPEAQLREAGRMCKTYGIELATFNMVGLPGETVRMALDTVKLNARLGTDFIYTSLFYPFPQTELHALCAREGLITERVITDYLEGSALKFPRLLLAQFIFIRNFSPLLMHLYKSIFTLPAAASRRAEALLDALLSSRLTAVVVCLPVNLGYFLVRENRALATLRNLVLRWFGRERIS
jgi:hypothetical protein